MLSLKQFVPLLMVTIVADLALASELKVPVHPPFESVQGQPSARADQAIHLRSMTGDPPANPADGPLCTVTFKAMASNAQSTQKQINDFVDTDDYRKMVAGMIGLTFSVDRIGPFKAGGVTGVELLVRPKSGPDFENARQFMSLGETPQGRTTMACSTTAKAFASAIPKFRNIRSGITFP